MARAAAIFLVLAIPSLAAAQTTTCGEELGRWVCRTQQPPPTAPAIHGYVPPPQPDFFAMGARAYEQGRAQAAARAAQQQQRTAQMDADQAAIVQGRVAAMVRDGDCAGAKNLALTAGDMNLAQQAVSLCTPK